MRNKRNHLIMSLLSASILVFVSCGEKVPVREMTQARTAIAKATSVMAEKYAPNELQAAKGKLLECHDQIKNEDDYDKVKATAEASFALANEAFLKSVPILAKDTISVAEKSLDDARSVYAEELAKDEFKSAEDGLKKANESYENKNYYESYLAALDADNKAKSARNSALGKKDVLRDSITEVKNTLEDAKKYGAEKYSPEKYKIADENLQAARKAYESTELKKGFSAVQVAKMNADEALVAALEATAKKKVPQAENVIGKAKKLSGVAGKDEIRAAEESLGNAKSALADKKYRESIAASDEAMRLANVATGNKLDLAGLEGKVATEGEKEPVKEEGEKTTPDSDKEYILYKVKWRENDKDCLWKITKKYYKNPYLWRKIYDANRDKIKNPNFIYPGWVLKIPKLK